MRAFCCHVLECTSTSTPAPPGFHRNAGNLAWRHSAYTVPNHYLHPPPSLPLPFTLRHSQASKLRRAEITGFVSGRNSLLSIPFVGRKKCNRKKIFIIHIITNGVGQMHGWLTIKCLNNSMCVSLRVCFSVYSVPPVNIVCTARIS